MEATVNQRCLMVKITQEEVRKLGAISQISIDDAEASSLLNKLEAVLSYAAYLKEIAGQHGQYTMPHNVNIMRADESRPCDPELVLSRAPVREENYFVVPMILKKPDL
jgi:aspartyl/glutamyl-tRNA(Asn/Gln) amidotransferase C subunit